MSGSAKTNTIFIVPTQTRSGYVPPNNTPINGTPLTDSTSVNQHLLSSLNAMMDN